MIDSQALPYSIAGYGNVQGCRDGARLGLGYLIRRSPSVNFTVRGALAGYNGTSDIVDGLTDALGGVNLLDV